MGASVLSDSIDCLAVNGNIATFAATGILFYRTTVVDNGPGGPLPDNRRDRRHPLDCSTPLDPASSFPLTGDIVVTDAQPFPTAKDQCKNGGWRNYPGFKNQGDCVSFVATSPKRPL